jgi:glucose/arabinose dehydrogenase
VGEVTWEEIDDARAGRNFGWPTTEGAFNASSFPQFTNPVYSYRHSGTTPSGCAITGFFADYCSGWISSIDPNNPATVTQFAMAISSPVDLKIGSDGALYYLARGAGSVGKILPISAPPAAPTNLRIVP